jgi:hypothetical protein
MANVTFSLKKTFYTDKTLCEKSGLYVCNLYVCRALRGRQQKKPISFPIITFLKGKKCIFEEFYFRHVVVWMTPAREELMRKNQYL